ncbi:glycosyltransferase family 4 protein [Virgibacillus pantothenticus]|uniref:glycosyltransferase family 4 protein n=1 Tax=Virgibacillus pantothenticus TaxID=1473 RepID=UPI00147ED226|nr:glycosyltransferase family 4 protein [Virgibacillus pantothenticus]
MDDSKLRILRLTPHFYIEPPSNKKWPVRLDPLGGMQVQIHRLSKALDYHGIPQINITMGSKYDTSKKIFKNSRLWTVLLPILPLKSRTRGTIGLNQAWGLGTILSVLSNFSSLKKNIDIVHCHCSGVASPLLIGWLVSKILNKRLVYTIHCSRAATYKPMSLGDKLINGFIKRLEVMLIRKASKTILLTERVRNVYLNLGINESKLSVIPDIAEINKKPVRLDDREENIIKNLNTNNKKVILFCGRIAHEKGWRMILNIAKSLKNQEDILVIFCGDGNERKLLEKEVCKNNLNEIIKITGFVKKDTVPIIMLKADIIVVPSIHEELGGTVLEALLLNKFVIASNVGGIPELLSHPSIGVLINPYDTNKWIKEVKKHIHNTTKPNISLINKALLPYRLPTIIKKHEQIYNEVCC